jgi:hypothetical protein
MYERLAKNAKETNQICTFEEERERMKTQLNSLDDLNTEADMQIGKMESNHQALCDNYEKSMKDVAEAIH